MNRSGSASRTNVNGTNSAARIGANSRSRDKRATVRDNINIKNEKGTKPPLSQAAVLLASSAAINV